MDPAPVEPAEHLRLLRQQLLLAQARVMEIEDERDTSQQRLDTCEARLREAQLSVDSNLEHADHLERTLVDAHSEAQHLRHVQHTTTQTLEQMRLRVTELEAALARSDAERAALANAQQSTTISLGQARAEFATAAAERDQHAARVAELDREQREMKASRSWRWTAWLRSVERAFGAKR